MNNTNNKKIIFQKYFFNVLEAFVYPVNKFNILDTFSLLVVSVFVFFMPSGTFLTQLLLLSCAIVYFRRKIQGTQEEKYKEHIFGYAFKMFPIVLTITIVNFALSLMISFTSLIQSALRTKYIFSATQLLSEIYVKECIVTVLWFFFLVPFFISCARRKILYFETEDIICTLKLIKEKFIQLLLIFLPYLIYVIIETLILYNINIFFQISDRKILIATITRITNDYMFLVTFILAAQIYISELKNNFDFSLKFERKRKTNQANFKS